MGRKDLERRLADVEQELGLLTGPLAETRRLARKLSDELADTRRRLHAIESAAWPAPTEDTRSRPQLPAPGLAGLSRELVASFFTPNWRDSLKVGTS